MKPPPVPDRAIDVAADAVQPFGPLGAQFAHEEARVALNAAWPVLFAEALRWAADVAEARATMAGVSNVASISRTGHPSTFTAEIGPRGVTWLRAVADRVSPASGDDDQ